MNTRVLFSSLFYRLVIGLLLLLICGVLSYAGYKGVLKLFQAYPILKIDIVGDLNFVEPAKLQSLVIRCTEGTNYFQVPLEELRREMLQLEWIEEVRIKKVWPNRLEVFLVELRPVAVWQNKFLISSKGDLVEVEDIEVNHAFLPRLSGGEDQVAWLLESYQLMTPLLNQGGGRLIALELTDYFHWRLSVHHGGSDVEVWLARDKVIDQLARFNSMMDAISALGERRPVRLDLRYPQGIAVKWAELDENAL